ncbi:MAG TPA: NAD-dependent epimerase/dehydratase family protein [Pseudonocardiaceae bacterium]|nr:NAD-dependent epimerase/dehydratase family protein [Pseudonocardiaceae bacterium]
MRLLVLGGTGFVGGAVAVEAVARGHEVTCAARGKSGTVPEGATHVPVDRDVPDGLAALAGSSFDAVVDIAPMSYPWVADALELLAPSAGHWTFVSTVNVYADNETQGQGPDAPLLEPLREGRGDDDAVDPNRYGAIKVASENAVRETMGDKAFVVRPGLITGPGDRSDRFGYWPGRFARGGKVVVPDSPDQPIQIIDVRDLATWIVAAGERGTTGTYDGIGPVSTLGPTLREIADLAGGDAELVPVAPEKLTEAGINYYGGPKSLPLWLPPSHWGMKSHDPRPSLDAGMPVRPLADTVAGALATERELGLDRPRKSGLSLEEEAAILA